MSLCDLLSRFVARRASSEDASKRARVERLTHPLGRADDIPQTFEREVLAVQRDQHAVGRHQGFTVSRPSEAEADQEVVELSRARQTRAAGVRAGASPRVDLGAGQLAVARELRQVGISVGMTNRGGASTRCIRGVVDGAGSPRLSRGQAEPLGGCPGDP